MPDLLLKFLPAETPTQVPAKATADQWETGLIETGQRSGTMIGSSQGAILSKLADGSAYYFCRMDDSLDT
ncbi:MAG: hypothetical protein ACI8TF_001418 [Paracoccaceae bacterium]|jgi:hypothetical protein